MTRENKRTPYALPAYTIGTKVFTAESVKVGGPPRDVLASFIRSGLEARALFARSHALPVEERTEAPFWDRLSKSSV